MKRADAEGRGIREPEGTDMASARDHYFEGEGVDLLDVSILRKPELRRYLANRLESAFLSGYRIGFADAAATDRKGRANEQ